ncbi:membrane protein insertase YidC [Henriciella marina]|uniref:membrane protein insertase YidC n=1 Tax=Henriciella marina TaxID=453851 RepID=UPI001F28C6EC|nr:membrane protein insertase YidC [Henriciella marina]
MNNGMDPQDQRNFIIAMVLMIAFVFGYQTFVVQPQQEARNEAQQQAEAEQEATVPQAGDTGEQNISAAESVDEALSSNSRITLDADRVDGSVRLRGAILDDLQLKDHFTTVEKINELRLLRPTNFDYGYFASWYWFDGNQPVAGPSADWQVSGNPTLSTGNPVTLTYEGNGVSIERTISVDDNYMFTYTDAVTNTGSEQRTLAPLGSIRRQGDWKDFLDATDPGSSKTTGMAHMGLIGVFDDNLTWRNYKNMDQGKGLKDSDDIGVRRGSEGGWLGFTDKYWMTSLIPEQQYEFAGRYQRLSRETGPVMQLTVASAGRVIEPGETITSENRIFSGAKELAVLDNYQEAGVPRFEDAIDWGNILYYITKPLFSLLRWLEGMVGTFGLAILALTVLVRLPLVPLYNQSYKSMAKMKNLAEPMKEIQERFKEDPQRRQQEVMKLYQREKANPIAGCIPILLTIPVFFALYKVLYVTIEMRHAPFLYIRDLSAPDPTAIGNLFGLLPWAAADVKAVPIIGIVIGIGILPILYGVTMSGIQALSPPPTDPTQKMIMRFLPLIFMFVFGGFAAGLVLYWVWSNVLSLVQQYFIMRRNGVETELDKLIGRLLGHKKEDA